MSWSPTLLKIALELDSLLLRSARESTSGTSSEIYLFRKVIDIYKIMEDNNTFLIYTDLSTTIASDTHKALGRFLCNSGYQRNNISGNSSLEFTPLLSLVLTQQSNPGEHAMLAEVFLRLDTFAFAVYSEPAVSCM